MSVIPWLVLLAPLASAAIIALVTRRARRPSAFISVVAVLISFICSCIVFAKPEISATEIPWIEIPGFLRVPIGFTLDSLSKTMLVLVSGVGALIHIYSLGYMRDDSGKSRYFASLSLFMFSMLGIVLAGNFVMMFIFWELVGLCSYLLIGHWFERDGAADAAKKAFITNRIGDFGFMLGILMVWGATGSVVFDDIILQLWRVTSNPTFLTICVLLIFCGAVGKSAQFPLHVWLPDAMEGPTPISALIHAATMVAAGVYMLVRVGFLVQASPDALCVIAWIGTITAVMAALIGCPPFAGFFSKDAILSLAYNRNPTIFVLALVTAFLTAFYMMRLFVVVFFGKPRSPVARTSREAPTSMLIPLVVLAVLALIGGFNFFARHFLTLPHERDTAQFVPGLALVAMLVGATAAIFLYRGRESDPFSFAILRKKFYFDEFYRALINATQELLARISAFIDRWVIDATAVRGSSGATWSLGALLRLMQVGNLQAYAFIFGLGIIWVIYFALFR